MERIPYEFESGITSEELLKNLYLLSGMTVTLYNSYRLWVASYPRTNCNLCRALREDHEIHMQCRAVDSEAFDMCTKLRGIYAYRCHKGLYEAIIPIFNEDAICGYLLLGQVLLDTEESKQRCRDHINETVFDAERKKKLLEALDGTQTMSEEKFQAVLHLMEVYANRIFEKNLLKNEVNDLPNLVAMYIREHFTSKITNAELCYVFLCDRKKLTTEFKQAHGMTIIEYTNNLRLRKARETLKANPDLSIGYVASVAGFSDQGYFGKLFYKKYGMLPTEMQSKYKNEAEQKKHKTDTED